MALTAYSADLTVPVKAMLSNGPVDLGFFAESTGVVRLSRYFVRLCCDGVSRKPLCVYLLGGWNVVLQRQGPDVDGLVSFGSAATLDYISTLLRSKRSCQ